MDDGRTGHRVRRRRSTLAWLFALAVLVAAAAGTAPVAPAEAQTFGPQPPFSAFYFGISASANFTQLPAALQREELDLMKQIGVHWLRVTVPWQRVQHVKQYPDKWELVDRVMNEAAKRKMVVDAIVDKPPAWAMHAVPHVPCPVQPPFNATAYGKFAAAVAARYPYSVLRAIELENSPNIPGVWRKPNACAYASVMKESYGRIKAADRRVLVLTGGLGGTQADATHIPGDVFLDQLYQHGAKGNFDVVSFHPYSYPCVPGQACSKDRSWYRLPQVRATMVQHGDSAKPLWATEFGAPTNGAPGDGHVTEQQQSDILLAGMKQFRKYPWSGPFFTFTFRDYGTNTRRKADWYGLVSHSLKHKKPAFAMYRYEATGQGPPP
jgi:polysaccharide biosynthesis protein PslG